MFLNFQIIFVGRRTSQNSESHQPLNNQSTPSSGGSRLPAVVTVTTESASSQPVQRSSSSASTARPSSRGQASRGQQVHRSSSMNQSTSPATPQRQQVRRHNSATAVDTPPNRSAQRRPPPLIRGGFLQSSVNGPSIPVYTVPGSNEAYVALTDLPSLQMPSMDDVPAYVSDIQDPFPMDEPPPYTPNAEQLPFFSPPAFTPNTYMPDIAEGASPEPTNSPANPIPSQQQPTPSAEVTVETVQQVLRISPGSTPRSEQETNNELNQGGFQPLPPIVDAHSVVPIVGGRNSQQGLGGNSLVPSNTPSNGQLYEQARLGTQSAFDGSRVVQSSAAVPTTTSRSGSQPQSRSASRSRENTPTRHDGRREPPAVAQSLSISESVARTNDPPVTSRQQIDPRVTGARPKHGNYPVNSASGPGGANGGAQKKRSKSPTKSNNTKGKQRSSHSDVGSRPRILPDVNGSRLPDTEIRSTSSPKKPSKKTEHRSKAENRSPERKQSAKRQKSSSSDKRHKNESKSWSKRATEPPPKQSSKKKVGSPSKGGSTVLKLNIPESSSDEETMNGIMDLVESVHHTPRGGQRSKEQKRAAKGKGKKGLLDSKV